MKPAELGKLAAGFVAGKVAAAAVQRLVPNSGTSNVDEGALVLVGGFSGWKATKPGKWNKLYAGAMLAALSPVLDTVAARVGEALPIGGEGEG